MQILLSKMIKLLKKLYGDAQAHLYTVEAFAMNPLHDNSKNHLLLLQSIGEAYIMCEKLKSHIKKVERINAYCLSELNGTFYDDYEKKYENDPDYEQKNTIDRPYEYILSEWDNHPLPEIDHTIIAFVEVYAEFDTKITESLIRFFPDAGPFQQSKTGEMQKKSLLNCQIDNNLKAGSLLADIEEYNLRIKRIKEIATIHGSFGEIMNLISR